VSHINDAPAGHGLVWNVPLIKNASVLRPGQTTPARRLVFKFSNLQPISNKLLQERGGPDLVTFDARILAKH